MIQLLVKKCFSSLGQILYKLALFHLTHKKEGRKESHCDVTENMWCHLTATVGRWFPPPPFFAHDLFNFSTRNPIFWLTIQYFDPFSNFSTYHQKFQLLIQFIDLPYNISTYHPFQPPIKFFNPKSKISFHQVNFSTIIQLFNPQSNFSIHYSIFWLLIQFFNPQTSFLTHYPIFQPTI